MRVTRGFKARRRRNKVLDRAKGFRGSNSRCYVTAAEKTDRALVFAYRDRRTRKRDFRKLWIQRINAAARQNGCSYSVLMNALKKSQVSVNRKMLADLAFSDAKAFSHLVQQVSPKS